jgi:outer membrane immunogenic protein
MKKVAVGVAVALALTTSNAAADGVDRRYPPTIAAPAPYVAPLTWSGFYVGAGVGGGAVVYDVSVRDVDLGTLASLDGIGGEGVFGTVIAGWDWQLGQSTVLGVFADYDFSDISTDLSVNEFIRASIDHNNSWSVGARLGFLTNPSTLWYATAGYTEAEFEAFASIADTTGVSRDRNFSGYFVGGGVDTRLAASNWFLRLEYRFTEFDNETIAQLDDVTRLDVEPSMHTARATLTYKFGGYGWGWGK